MPRPGDEGSVALWLLGLCVMLLFLGGISLDLWRAFSERRALAGIADAAVVAGSTGIDEQHFRDHGEPVLDPPLAEQRARASLAAQTDARALTGAHVDATASEVAVTLRGAVPLTLLRVLGLDQPFDITVTARAYPARSP